MCLGLLEEEVVGMVGGGTLMTCVVMGGTEVWEVVRQVQNSYSLTQFMKTDKQTKRIY